ncbi:hypothetical protein JM16_005313 [Phytophthora kernoviae]|uniref:PX domain-containing protein n=1 Tax=Phytophthora kernoviae TaxID=325452 RepID=A0A8T0LX87_9STRA|nr:hypothetical protein JM16_005313 [Phytophthora kernoviae]
MTPAAPQHHQRGPCMSCVGAAAPFLTESVAPHKQSDAGLVNPKKTGQCSGEKSTEQWPQQCSVKLAIELLPTELRERHTPERAARPGSCSDYLSPLCANVQTQFRTLDVQVLRTIITKTIEAMSSTTMKTQVTTKKDVDSSDLGKPTIVLQMPGVRLALLTNAYDSLVHLDITLNSAASLLIATYIACMLTWHIFAFCLTLLVNTVAFAVLSSATFVGCTMLSTGVNPLIPNRKEKSLSMVVQLPPLCIDGSVLTSKSTHFGKTDDTVAIKRKESQVPAARRRVLAHLNRNRLLVNVVPGDKRRRCDMSLGDANIRVGKAFLQAVPGMRKPRDIYVVRVDCGAQSATEEKHMNPVIMWDLTATFDEFKKLEHCLKKEVKAKKETRGVKVPHLSSGAVLFVQPELTEHVLNARRVRVQTFLDGVRSNPNIHAPTEGEPFTGDLDEKQARGRYALRVENEFISGDYLYVSMGDERRWSLLRL